MRSTIHSLEASAVTWMELLLKLLLIVVLLCQNTSEYVALGALYNSTNGNYWDWQNSTSGAIWFSTAEDPCGDPIWQGLTCDCASNSSCHVSKIQLNDYRLVGTIPYNIGEFSYLTALNLGRNLIESTIPSELYLLSNLTVLNIELNFLTGSISDAIGNVKFLQEINLANNKIGGTLPSSLGTLNQMLLIDLQGNDLRGTIPQAIFLLSNLINLGLDLNHLSGTIPFLNELVNLQLIDLAGNGMNGTIPDSFGNMVSLERVSLGNNNFTGSIPESFYSLTQLRTLDLYYNAFNGTLSNSIGSFTEITNIGISNNYFSGTIPSSIERCNKMILLDLSENNFRGTIPEGIYGMDELLFLLLLGNQLTGTISSSLGNLALMQKYQINRNKLTGPLPSNVKRMVSMTYFNVGDNYFNGTIPEEFFDLPSLVDLQLGSNAFTGTISNSIGNLPLNYLTLADNHFHGTIPESLYDCELFNLYLSNNEFSGTLSNSFGKLLSLSEGSIDGNKLTGTIPASIGNITGLQDLLLGYNYLNGTLPETLLEVPRMLTLSLYANQLSGTISERIGRMTLLRYLSFGENDLNGTIPTSIGLMHSLLTLDLDGNKLSGTIPYSFSNLTSLTHLQIFNNELTGSLPVSIGHLRSLQQLSCENNNLNGSIPSGLYKLHYLNTLTLNNNGFSGSLLADFGNLTELSIVNLASNRFTGQFPPAVGNLRYLKSLYADDNALTGSLPKSLCNNQLLTAIYFQDNYLSGSIHECIFKVKDLTALFLYNNSLTGTIPVNVSSVTLGSLELSNNFLEGPLPRRFVSGLLQVLELSYNVFTGPIGDNMFNTTQFQELLLNNNKLSGSIPLTLGRLPQLNYLDLSTNLLSDKLPLELSRLVNLEKFFVNKNSLSGSIACFDSVIQQNITNIELSNNQFTGTLPAEVFNIQSLQTFAAVSNCFTGSIPPDVCNANGLTALALDGLHTAPACHIDLLPFDLTPTYTLNYYLKGSIPSCLFNITSLNTLHVSGNGIKGSLPSSLVIGDALTDLALSYNQFTGLVPNAITYKSFYNLDMSFNRFTGDLPDDLAPAPANGSVFLEVNRISGNIPGALRDCVNISILNGNLFTCDYERKSLPKHDQDYTFYSCGTSELEQAIYAWMILAGLTLGFAVLIIVVHRVYKYDRRGYYWIQLAKSFYVKMRQWRKIYHNKDKNYSLPNVRLFGKFCTSLRRAFLRITIFILLVILPINVALAHNFSMYQYQYAWNVASVLNTGFTPAIVYMFMFMAFMCFAFGVFYVNLVNFRTVKVNETVRHSGRFSPTGKNTNSGRFAPVNGNGNEIVKPTQEQLQEARNTMHSVHSTSSLATTSTNGDEKVTAATSSYKHYMCLFAVALFNFVIVLSVNVAYVYITTKYRPVVVAITQLFLAAFKLVWNDLAIRGLTILAHNYSTKSVSLTAAEERALEGKYMSFNTYTLIFNIIVIPCLATAAVSSDCFYDVLFPPPNIDSSYSYKTCATLETVYQLKQNNCTQYEEVTTTTSYQPPFVYRYQCSSALITTYAVLYVYNFIIAAFGQPLMLISLAWLCTVLNSESKLYLFLKTVMPKLYQHNTKINPDDTRIFFKDRFNLRMSMYLSVFMTFGVIFPPLAVIICLAVFVQSYFTELSIGRMLDGLSIETYSDLKILQIFDYDCANTGDIFKQTVVYVGPISAFIYAFLLFDTYGDAVGGTRTVWMDATMFTVGCLISVVYVIAVKRKPPESITERQSETGNKRRISEITIRQTESGRAFPRFSAWTLKTLRRSTFSAGRHRSTDVDNDNRDTDEPYEDVMGNGRTSSTNPVHVTLELQQPTQSSSGKMVADEKKENDEL